MAGKRKGSAKNKTQAKRVVTEIAPGVRTMLDDFLKAYNEGPERVSSPLKYTDVLNKALDGFLPGRPEPEAEDDSPDAPSAIEAETSVGTSPEA